MIDIKIRLGSETDTDSIAELYDEACEHIEATAVTPWWAKGVYPVRETAECGIKEECLYVATYNDEIVGTMILRHKPEDAYLKAQWQKDLDYENVLVVYTIAASPRYLGQGVGLEMLRFATELARNMNMKALRLDVYENNKPAIRLYEKAGFVYIDTVSLGLEDIGLDWFRLYEKLL